MRSSSVPGQSDSLMAERCRCDYSPILPIRPCPIHGSFGKEGIERERRLARADERHRIVEALRAPNAPVKNSGKYGGDSWDAAADFIEQL